MTVSAFILTMTKVPLTSESFCNASWVASLDAEAVAAARSAVVNIFLIVVKFKIIVSVD